MLTRGFWAGKYEVRRRDWRRVVGKLPGELNHIGFRVVAVGRSCPPEA
jgi:hypothetical protein